IQANEQKLCCSLSCASAWASKPGKILFWLECSCGQFCHISRRACGGALLRLCGYAQLHRSLHFLLCALTVPSPVDSSNNSANSLLRHSDKGCGTGTTSSSTRQSIRLSGEGTS